MKTLFFLGNKRSGTTMLMKLLNLHPGIFVSNESDLVWILYCLHNKDKIAPYPKDSPKGFNKTMEKHGESIISNAQLPVEKHFLNLLQKIKIDEFGHDKKKQLLVAGDQKMFQHTESDVFEFIGKNFSNPYFLHIHRHPFYVVRSQKNFQQETGAPDYDNIWSKKTDAELIDEWVFYEERVLNLKNHKNIKLIDIDYEQLILRPFHELKRISRFLELRFPFYTYWGAYLLCRKKNRQINDTYNLNDHQRAVMAKLGYQDRIVSKVRFAGLIKSENLFKRVLLKSISYFTDRFQ